MRTLEQLESALDDALAAADPVAGATFLLHVGEEALENWLHAHDKAPTHELKEGFRILALHRQGAKGDPSFNAVRETCRELVFHYNLIRLQPEEHGTSHRLEMMRLVARHIVLFIAGKLQIAGLGEFCCSSKPIRLEST